MENTLTIIVLTWNSSQYIENCLTSLVREANYCDIAPAIYVIDNGSSDDTFRIIRRLQNSLSSVFLIPLGRNMGTSFSRNIVLRSHPLGRILICDSDTEWTSGSLYSLLRFSEIAPRAGIICPKLLFPDGRYQISAKKFPSLAEKLAKATNINFLKHWAERTEAYSGLTEPSIVDYCISAAWLLSPGTVDKVGLFDENIFYAPEDVDYCLRCWKAGIEVWYVPEATVIHHCQRLSYRLPPIAFSHLRGLIYYFYKHRYVSRLSLYKKLGRHGRWQGK